MKGMYVNRKRWQTKLPAIIIVGLSIIQLSSNINEVEARDRWPGQATTYVSAQRNSYYDDGDYRGSLGSYVYSGLPADSKYVSAQTSSYYSDSGGYSGSLSQYVYSGTPYATKYVTNQSSASYNSGGYSGTLTQYVHSGSPADSKTVSISFDDGYVYQYYRHDGERYRQSRDNVGTSRPNTYYYNSGGYSGTIPRVSTVTYVDTKHHSFRPDLPQREGATYTWVRRYRYTFTGTVTKPDTQVWRYQGTVTRPDTQVYRYRGYVYRPDTRTWRYRGTVYEIDKIDPRIDIKTLSTNNEWRKDFPVEVEVWDDESGIAYWTVEELADHEKNSSAWINKQTFNVNDLKDTRTITLSATGKRKIRVTAYDMEGNSKTQISNVYLVDGSAPSATFIPPSRTEWKFEGVDVNIQLHDSPNGSPNREDAYYASGVDKGYYQWSESISRPSTWEPINGYNDTVSHDETGRWYLHAKVIDRAGNTGYTYTGPYNIDKEAPTITANPTSRGFGQDMTVTLNHADAHSGVEIKQYKWSTSSNVPSTWDTYTKPVTQDQTGVWYLHARAVDFMGIETIETFGQYLVDKTLPTGVITPSETDWTTDDISLRLVAEDEGGSGYKRTQLPDGSFQNNNDVTYVATKNGTYTFIMEDGVGNKQPISYEVTNIDRTPPTGTISEDISEWTNGNVELSITPTDEQSGVQHTVLPDGTLSTAGTPTYTATENGDYTFTLVDNVDNEQSFTFEVDNIDRIAPEIVISNNATKWTNQDVILHIATKDSAGTVAGNFYGKSDIKQIHMPDGSIVSTPNAQFVVTENGDYTFTVEDHAGNTTTVTETVSLIDKDLPTLNITGNATYWTNENVVFTITADDTGGSKVKSITLPNGSVKTFTEESVTTYTVSVNDTYTFKVLDHAGNVTTYNMVVDKIDKKDPTATITPSTTNWTNQDIILTIDSEDFGDKPIRSNVPTYISGIDYIVRPDGTRAYAESATFIAKRNATYTFEVVDKAGNSITRTIIIKNIDKEAPSESVIDIIN